MSVTLTCSITGSSTITHSFQSYLGQTVPSWVSLDEAQQWFVFNPPSLTADTNFAFTVKVTSSENSISKTFNVFLTVAYCQAEHCTTWATGDGRMWKTWVSGYSFYNSPGVWELGQSSTSKTSSTVTQVCAGIGVLSNAISAGVNLSSPQSAYTILNHFRLLALLLLTYAYFPQDIVDYFSGMKIASFSFSFIKRQQRNISGVDS